MLPGSPKVSVTHPCEIGIPNIRGVCADPPQDHGNPFPLLRDGISIDTILFVKRPFSVQSAKRRRELLQQGRPFDSMSGVTYTFIE